MNNGKLTEAKPLMKSPLPPKKNSLRPIAALYGWRLGANIFGVVVSFIRKFESKKIYTSFPFYCIGPRENDLTRSDLDTRGISFVCVQNTEFDSSQSVMSVAHITNHDVSFPSQ